jgi:hypothetical protein
MDLVTWAAEESRARLEPLGSRWLHCRGVAACAHEVRAVVAPGDRGVLVAAAYLHDVGYAPELVRCGFHPLDAASWLQAQGLHRLAGLVAHHTAARFEAQAHGLADELAAFEDERSAVTDALTYGDLTTGPTGERVTVAERLGEIERRYGPTSLVVRALERASDALLGMVARTEQRLAAWSGPREQADGERGTFSARKTSSRGPSTR